MPKILFTGGGSSGHVTPNLALIDLLQKNNWQVAYAGSENGIEKTLISKINIPYYSISTGKLRRHLTWKNLLTPFQVIAGILQAYFLCRRLKPNVVFSKGGFVAFPIVAGAWLNRIPVIAHESDLTPGLANRLSFPFAKNICVTFDEGKKYFKSSHKVIVTGTPIRDSLLHGSAEKGREFCGFNPEKPILLIIGGGLGSDVVNLAIRQALPELLDYFQIIHICGKNKTDPTFENIVGYKQVEYLHGELSDVFACTDIIISRAGANSIYEFLALRKPHILIPLSTKASRGDQIENAKYLADRHLSVVIYEEYLTKQHLLENITTLLQQKQVYIDRLAAYPLPDSLKLIDEVITRAVSKMN